MTSPQNKEEKHFFSTEERNEEKLSQPPENMMDQSIKMICDTHKAPAVFFSQKEERYVCFKCLVTSEKLLYIDKSYKQDMDDFEKIKKMTEEAIRSNV